MRRDRSQWTAEEREFDRIMDLIESPDQVKRIDGRFEWPKFAARFTKEELDAMAETIGAKPREVKR